MWELKEVTGNNILRQVTKDFNGDNDTNNERGRLFDNHSTGAC